MNASDSLYDWFDDLAKDDLAGLTRIGCCQQIVSSLGTLAGLGVPTATLATFTRRTLEGIDRMMGVVREDRSVEENILSVLEEAGKTPHPSPESS